MKLDRCFQEGWFPLHKRPAQVAGFMDETGSDLDDSKNELFRLVQGRNDLLTRNHHTVRAIDASLNLNETQMP